MPKLIGMFSAITLCLGMSSPAAAGSNHYEFNVAGSSMSCLSWQGQPVKIVNNPRVSTLGRSYSKSDGSAVIEINPGALNAFSGKVQRWWLAHECAHHELPPQLNSEKKADCMAVKRVKREEGLTVQDAELFMRELHSLGGSHHGHLPGPERARHVLKCAGFAPVVTA